MKALKIAAVVAAILAVIYIFAAPIGPAPGFFIGGNAAAAPASWPDTSQVDEIRLGVPGTPPRVVIIWMTEYEGEMYVAGAKDSGWVSRIGSGGPVQMRLGDDTYDLTAEPVNQGWEPVLRSYIAKYEEEYPDIVAGFPAVEEAGDYMTLFHLKRS